MGTKVSTRGAALLCGAVLALSASCVLAQSTAAGPTQRVIVKWRLKSNDGTATAARTLASMQARFGVAMTSMRTLATGGEVIRLSQRLTPAQMQDLITNLSSDPAVEYAEEDRMLRAAFTPNDPEYSQQWHFFEAAGGLNLPPAWDLSIGTGIRVAVIDTGITPHPGLDANIIAGYDFISDPFIANDGNGRDNNPGDPGDFAAAGACGPDSPPLNSSWHGTHVSGTVAAVTNNGAGVAGVAFGAKVIPVRALGRCGGLTSDVADAVIWASGGSVPGVPNIAARAHVLNLSLGTTGPCSATGQDAINSARSRGTVVVVAAGNDSMNASNATPANCAGVITVAANDRSGGRASYSNFGTVVDLAGPGGEVTDSTAANGVLSTLNLGTTTPASPGLAFYQGTSMATPHVAGVAALVLARNGALSPDQVESLLKRSTRPFPQACSGCGTGILNALAAVQAAATVTPLVANNLSGGEGSERFFTLVVPAGATNLRFQISGGSGDADLYVRLGSPPTTSAFNCRPFFIGNNEACTSSAPPAGTYYVLIRGFSAYSAVSLRGSYIP